MSYRIKLYDMPQQDLVGIPKNFDEVIETLLTFYAEDIPVVKKRKEEDFLPWLTLQPVLSCGIAGVCSGLKGIPTAHGHQRNRCWCNGSMTGV